MKYLYFRSFLAFHSPVVERDLCSLDNSHTPAVVADLCSLSAPLLLPGQAGLVLVSHAQIGQVGFMLVSQTDGLQRGRMDRAALCSFLTLVASKGDG